MKPTNKPQLEANLAKLSDAIEYIEDPSIKAMILQFATVYHRRVLRALEQSQFKKRGQAVSELDMLVERCQSQLDKAYELGVGVSAAEDALRSAWKVRDAAMDHLISPVDLDSAEMYVDTGDFDNQDL
jgi:hypothetical protein